MTFGTAFRLFTVMALWASCYPLITIGLDLAPHIAFAAARALLAGLGLLAVALLLGRPIPRGGSAWLLIALTGLGSTTLGFIGMFHAAEFVSPGLATVIANSQPLIAVILGRVVLGERLGSIGIFGFLAGFAGIVAIAWPALVTGTAPRFDLGISYILLAATGVAIGNVAMKRLSGKVDAAMAMGLQFLVGAVPLMLLSLLTEDVRGMTWSGEFLALTAALALLGTALAYWLWFAALERTSLNRANAFAFLTPLIGLGIGAMLFAERLAWIQFVGVGAVLGGVVLVQLGTAKTLHKTSRGSTVSDRAQSPP